MGISYVESNKKVRTPNEVCTGIYLDFLLQRKKLKVSGNCLVSFARGKGLSLLTEHEK